MANWKKMCENKSTIWIIRMSTSEKHLENLCYFQALDLKKHNNFSKTNYKEIMSGVQ